MSSNIGKIGIGMAGALACAGLMSSGVAGAATFTASGSQWNDASTATNGAPGTGATIVTTGSLSPGLTLSYGAYASTSTGAYNNGGLDSASAGYSSSYSGSSKLTVSDSAFWTSSYVGLSGSFGDLSSTTMSFTVESNSSNNASAHPYAILTATDGTDSYDVINMMSGSAAYSISSASYVSIFNNNTSKWVTGNGSGNNYKLSTIYNTADPNASNLTYGDLAVTEATANIGSFGSNGINETAYIGSMSVATPIPASFGLVGIGSLVLIGGLVLRRRMAATL